MSDVIKKGLLEVKKRGLFGVSLLPHNASKLQHTMCNNCIH